MLNTLSQKSTVTYIVISNTIEKFDPRGLKKERIATNL